MRCAHEPPRFSKEERRRRRRRSTTPSAATSRGLRRATWRLRRRRLLTSYLIREPCTSDQGEQNNHNPTKHNVSPKIESAETPSAKGSPGINLFMQSP